MELNIEDLRNIKSYMDHLEMWDTQHPSSLYAPGEITFFCDGEQLGTFSYSDEGKYIFIPTTGK